MEIAAFLGLEELGADGRRRFIPTHAFEHVGASTLLTFPTLWYQVGPRTKQIYGFRREARVYNVQGCLQADYVRYESFRIR